MSYALTLKLSLTQNIHSFVHWSALAFSILSLAWVLKATWGVYRKNTSDGGSMAIADEERAPLAGGF